MPITITIDQNPEDPNILDVDVTSPEEGDPCDEQMLDLAELVITELMRQLHHDPETCPVCQGKETEGEGKPYLH